jgi:pimeloyl-ACP methyl ester carboxylesterase
VARIALAVACGTAAGSMAGLAVSTLRPPSAVHLGAVLLAGTLTSAAVPGRRGNPPARWTSALLVTAVLVAVAGPRPLAAGPAPVEGAGRIRTPDGAELVYHHLGATTDLGTTPVVFLHGGPGVSTLAQDLPWLEELARVRPVVAYDQIGVGGSSRLADPTDYSLRRARDDLETVRRRVGFERMILVGHSWGSVVAASYVAEHPEHVDAVVALAPGSLDGHEVADDPSVRLRGRDRVRLWSRLLRPRELYTYALAQVDPVTAHRIIGDAEMDRRYDAILHAVWPAMACDPARAAELPAPRGGFFANQLAGQHATADLVPQVTAPPPTLVVKPECDYLPWSVVEGYVERLDAEVAYVRGAGHAIHAERGDLMVDIIEGFLAGRTVEGSMDDPATMPPSYRGPR